MNRRSDFEGALRTMLRERAADIQRVPPGLASLAEDAAAPTADRTRHGHRWLRLTATVAAVLAIAGGAVGIRGLAAGHHVRPFAPISTPVAMPPRPHPAPPDVFSPGPPTSAPPASRSLTSKTACTASLPPAWTDALAHGVLRLGAEATFPQGATPDGQLLLTRDFGHSRDVVLLSRTGSTRLIYSVPDPDQHEVAAAIEGHYVLVTLDNRPRGAEQWVPYLTDILLVDLNTGTTTTVLHAQTHGVQGTTPSIIAAVLFHGHVYWDQSPSMVSTTTVIKDYDIASGATRTTRTGDVMWPMTTAAGVSWDPHGFRNGLNGHGTIQVPAALPAELAAAVPAAARATLVSDGTAYAWLDPSGAVGWWSPGQHPVLVHVPGGSWTTIAAVAGPYVISGSVLDTRTGAVATSNTLSPLTGGVEITGGAAGIAYGYTLPSGKDGPSLAVRINTTELPGLHC
jgi:hypothetical protein